MTLVKRFVGVFALLALVVCAGGTTRAQSATSFTLAPGGKATISFEGFCLDYAQKFPTEVEAPNDVAPAEVAAALDYARSNALTDDQAEALDVQYAIWQLRGATGSPQGGSVTTEVMDNAKTAPANPQGTSLIDAAKAGDVKITIDSWTSQGEKVQIGAVTDYFYGKGQLTVENTSDQELTLYMPVGAMFPPVEAGSQTIGAYATNVQTDNPQVEAQGDSPNMLPNTSDSNVIPQALSLLLGALALLGAGWAVRYHQGRPGR